MDFIKKLSISFVAIGLITSSSHANEEVFIEIAKSAIENTAKVAMKDVTHTKLQNVTLDSEVDIQESAVIGNVGSHISGDNIDASNSEIISKVYMARSFVYGNVGSSAGN